MALPMTIYDYHGNLLGHAATSGTIGGNYGARRVASGDSIFTGTGLVSYTTGESTWASGNVPGAESAITNSQVIFQSGSYVLAQPY
jgi:hypothetical protein